MSLATCPTPESAAFVRATREETTRDLTQAFRLFNELSVGLTESYRALEARVNELTDELARAHDGRLRELHEKEQIAGRLARLLEALPAGVIVLDGEGRIDQANPAAEQMLGEALAGRTWRDVVAAAIEMTPRQGTDIRLRTGRFVSVDTCALRDTPGQIVLLHDISDRREQESRLARHERLVAMGEMTANLAHQLRTPLATAVLYASQIGRRSAEAESRRHAEQIQNSLRHLERLANDMLRYVRGEPAGPREVIPAGELLPSVLAIAQDGLRSSGVQCTVTDQSGDARVWAARDLLISSIETLLRNAWQAAGAGGRIELEATVRDGWLTIAVQDNGPGIEPHHQARLFEPFFTTRAQGTGLGLAIAQTVARGHGGSLRHVPCPSRGSRFELTVPVHADNSLATERGSA